MIRFLVITILMYVFTSCGEPPNPEDYNSSYKKPNYEVKVDTTKVSKPQISNTFNNNSIIAKDTITITKVYKTTVAENSAGKFSVPITYIDISNNRIDMKLNDGNITWRYTRNLDPTQWLVTVGTPYTKVTNDGITIYTKNGSIIALKVDKTTYLFNSNIKPHRPQNNGSKLRYLDNYTVEVIEGQNLNWIIQRYNIENGTHYTLKEILNKNPYIKGRKNYTVYKGDTIQF